MTSASFVAAPDPHLLQLLTVLSQQPNTYHIPLDLPLPSDPSSSSSSPSPPPSSSTPTLPDTAPLLPILQSIASTGVLSGYPWPLVRTLLLVQLQHVTRDYVARTGAPPPLSSDEEAFPARYGQLLLLLHRFPHAPFTLQRLAELLLQPTAYYPTTSPFIQAVSKCILGISAEEPEDEDDSDDGMEEDDDVDALLGGAAHSRSALDFLSKDLPIATTAVIQPPVLSTVEPEDIAMQSAD